jgi:hypothetical protein
MKLIDIFERSNDSDFDPQNSNDHEAHEMKFPNVYGNHDYGRDVKIKKEKVVIRNTKTGKVYGARTIWQRDVK